MEKLNLVTRQFPCNKYAQKKKKKKNEKQNIYTSLVI